MESADANPSDRIASAERLLRERYGVEATARPLVGEVDENYSIETGDGRRWVFKLASDATPTGELDFQNRMLDHLRGEVDGLRLQQVVRAQNGEDILQVEHCGRSRRARMITYLEGTPWSAAGATTAARRQSLGRQLASLDRALSDFTHPAMHRELGWDLRLANRARAWTELIEPRLDRLVVEHHLLEFETIALPTLPRLRHGVIHQDAHDDNVLIGGENDDEVVGLIDFGDSMHAPLICELAIAIAYALLEQDDPLPAASDLVAGYHAGLHLAPDELDVLWPLTAARLCYSVGRAAYNARAEPDNAYLQVTRDRAVTTLRRMMGITSDHARECFQAVTDDVAGQDATASSRFGRTADSIQATRRRHFGKNLSLSYSQPLKIVRGAGQYLFDDRGFDYLDCVNNVSHVGHGHPDVVRAAQRQMATLNTNTRYLGDGLPHLVERLLDQLPAPLEVCFLVCTGTEANELALRLARAASGRHDVLVVDTAYHGNSSSMVDLSPYKHDGPGGKGRPEWVHALTIPDVYRGRHRGDDATARYLGELLDTLHDLEQRERAPAAFFCESILSCAGQIELPPGYLAGAFEAVRAAGGVCVSDEVQVGFGRVGSHFWAFETQGVVPDIVTMGKPMGNGHPVAAVVTTQAIADAFANGMEYFNTFGGNPVSCAIASAVLDVIDREGLQAHAHELGQHILGRFRDLQQRHRAVGDVRGRGLFLGLEFVLDRDTREPDAATADRTVQLLRERHRILLSTDGPDHNVIKFKPPLAFTREDADRTCDALDQVLKEIDGS